MTHENFVAVWEAFGERYLVSDKDLVGPPGAWFKVCKATRWWDDDRLPPETPVQKPVVKYKPTRTVGLPTVLTKKLPTALSGTLWPWESNDRHLTQWERWHADPKLFGLEPEPLLWWEVEEWEKEEWPQAA